MMKTHKCKTRAKSGINHLMWYNSKIAFKVIEATVLELSHWKLHTEVLTDRMGSNRNVYDQQSIFKSVFEFKKKID